jgi:hypothetical protein
MNMPVPVTVEVEALNHARQWIENMRTSDFNGWGVSPFDANGGAVLINQLVRLILNGEARHALIVIDWARAGWEPADLAIRNVLAEYAHRGVLPPPFLTEYLVRSLIESPSSSLSRGRNKMSNLLFDIALVTLVMTLCERFGLNPTRNPSARRRPSACSIVAQAASEAGLHRGGESAMNRIWKRYAPALTPGWQRNTSL